MTSPTAPAHSGWHVIKRVLKWLFILLLIVLLLAFLVESIFKSLDDRRYLPPGKLYSVGDHKMHLWCEGQGTPVIILDAGAGMFSSGWRWVMPRLSPSTKVCAFDRSGLGWSEPSEPPYDGISAANELNSLLGEAQIRLPFIYVGHSLGGNLGMIYHQQFPEDLSVLVMLEPANPTIFMQEIAEDRGAEVIRSAEISNCGMRCVIVSVMSALGVIDLTLELLEIVNDPLFHPLALAEFKARTNRIDSLQFLAQRGKYLTEVMFQAAEGTDFVDLPVSIFHSENAGELLGDHTSPEELIEDRNKNVAAYQAMLDANQRSLGLRKIDDANHLTMLMYEEPANQVAENLLEILENMRKMDVSASSN